MKYAILFSSLAAVSLAEQKFLGDLPLYTPNPEDGVSKSGKVEHPDFEPYPHPEELREAVLFEQFVGEPKDIFQKWKRSSAIKAKTAESPDEEFRYVGEWAIEPPTYVPGFKGDQGLVMKSPAAHHAISRKFDEPLDNKNKTLVVQYEVKLQQGLQCGGAYVKLLSVSDHFAAEEFSNDTPYQVMFGPDRCGVTDKVHLIIKRKDPNTGEYGERNLVAPPRTRSGVLSSLYTLILRPNQTYEIRINGETVKSGGLLDEGAFRPSFNPPLEIPDPEDKKPDDWVDDEFIPDPDQAVKPDDWDEDAPRMIRDPEAVKPDDWREDLDLYILDPEAEKPEDWDDEEDGEWIAPEIKNPACESISGCGTWQAPMIKNPDYRGKWRQPMISNPAYKGPWEPRKIPNPDYYEDGRPSDLELIGGIGFELWTMQADILFDNIYVGHSVKEAEIIGNATWSPKYYIETKEQSAMAKERAATLKKPVTFADFRANPLGTLFAEFTSFLVMFRTDKLTAFTSHPLLLGALATALAISFTVLFSIVSFLSRFTKKEDQITEKGSEKEEVKEAEAKVTSAKTADGVRKRK